LKYESFTAQAEDNNYSNRACFGRVIYALNNLVQALEMEGKVERSPTTEYWIKNAQKALQERFEPLEIDIAPAKN